MKPTTILASLTLLVAAAAPAFAASPAGGLPGVWQSSPAAAPLLLAQAGDPRVTQLEEQIRRLNGTIEELNFQILQMQEQIRKMQEDNEFRFQELENRSDARSGTQQRADRTPPAGGEATASTSGGSQDLGAPPRDFGTITFDQHGNVRGGGVAPGVAVPEGPAVAALPPAGDSEELYRNSYEFILSGDYATAEAGFRQHEERYPEDPRAADVQFWLGEALLGQQRYRDAAEVFLSASRNWPDSGKAPDMLLKLGVSLAAMNQRDIACATFAEVGQRYPGAPVALKERVAQERALAGC